MAYFRTLVHGYLSPTLRCSFSGLMREPSSRHHVDLGQGIVYVSPYEQGGMELGFQRCGVDKAM